MQTTDVRYPTGGLDKAAKAAVAERLTDVLAKMEGGANTVFCLPCPILRSSVRGG